MADKKISALTAAALPLAGTEVLPIVQSGATVKVASDDLTVKNVRANATTGILQVTGPAAGTTRVMTTPNANFTAARTDAAQTFSGTQTFSGNIDTTGITGNVINNNAAGTSGVTLLHIGTSGSDFYLGANSSVGGRLNSGSAAYTAEFRNDQGFSFGNGTQFAYVTSSGIQTTGNFIQGTAAKGVNFTANTPAAGMTSQLLNWYEEGTWTPNDQSGAGLSFTVSSALYTRIGRQVTVQFDITFPTTASTATQLMGGLPFVAGAQNYGGFVTYTTHANALNLLLYTSGGVSYISYRQAAGGSNNTNAAYSGNIIRGMCVYFI